MRVIKTFHAFYLYPVPANMERKKNTDRNVIKRFFKREHINLHSKVE